MTRRGWVIVVLVVACAATLVNSTLNAVIYQPKADEGYYLRDAIRIAEDGPRAFPALCRDYLDHAQTRQYFPHPLRLTTLLLDAAAVRLSGPSFTSLQQLSLLAFLALLIFMLCGLNRTLDERTALWGTLLLVVSPLHLAMARRALADSLVATLLVACLGLCIRAVTTEKGNTRQWWFVAVAYMVTFLAKEGAVVLIPMSVFFIGWHAVRHRRRLPLWPLCAVSLVPLIGALGLVSLAAGGFAIAWQVLSVSLASAATNPYLLQYGNGPWFRYLVDYLLLSPCTTLLYVLWLGYLIGARIHPALKSGVNDERLWAWALVPVLFIACSAPFTKNVRYALVLEVPMRLGAAWLLQQLGGAHASARWATIRIAILVAVLAWIDLHAFSRVFVVGDVYDPVSLLLLAVRRFLPMR